MLNNISKFNNVDKNKSKVAAKISPTTNGLIPLKTCLTILLSLNLSSILAMINITIILGATNDKVEITPPNGPKVIYPTYVAILMPIGPGVLSLTAIIVLNVSRSNQPYLTAISCKKGIVAKPPPTANKPVLKNSIITVNHKLICLFSLAIHHKYPQ